MLEPTAEKTVLDVGAETQLVDSDGLQFIDWYPWRRRLSAVNISPQQISLIRSRYPEVDARVGDACDLPWPDKSFDIVFSNAVIEHLGCWERQVRMALEIMRVGRSWFVTTPNRWFPFEFHIRLPLVTWLPNHGYQHAGAILSYNHVLRKYVFGSRIDKSLRLMTSRELSRCFPGSRIIRQRITFMPETLIAVGGDLCDELL